MTQHSNRKPADRDRINVYESWEELYWGEKLACTTDQLRAAVDAVGVMVVDVKAHLDKMRRSKTTSLHHGRAQAAKPLIQHSSATFH